MRVAWNFSQKPHYSCKSAFNFDRWMEVQKVTFNSQNLYWNTMMPIIWLFERFGCGILDY